ncbi:hypothetical protein [Flexithrix dorotheae]|uniref:hypothetical protein n=1 Tax=Flexithrix dorotheae TaxID=70993 RepID=UPI0003735E6F|nr:hypothetical protein [Flexithrix dorotheae]
MVVEIYKTNVTKEETAKKILIDFRKQFPDYNVNFDLEDCDKILRIESANAINQKLYFFKMEYE